MREVASACLELRHQMIRYMQMLQKRHEKILLWSFAIALLVGGGLYCVRFVQVDACLYRGGLWNYEANMCEGSESDILAP